MNKKEILVCKDNKGKCRVVQIEAIYNKEGIYWEIHRQSGLLNGKMIKQPIITILVGKAKRSLDQQCDLEFKSHIKKYLNKGYKTIQSLGHETLETFTEKDLPEVNTNQNGVKKPMLCEVYDPDDSKSQNIKWLASKKLDGLRCFIYMKDGELHTASRGGQDYDVAAYYILTDAYIKKLLTDNPNLILDGELYCHGWNLQKISGLGRLKTLHKDHSKLRFHCYDIVDEIKPFRERWKFLKSLKLPWNTLLTIEEHVEIKNDADINILHDKWVAEGYEGLVLRDPNQPYKCGGRDRRMQKVKKFTDDEFEILGLVEGLREEDMCFLMKTKEGYEFKAKPIGTREDKQHYREHLKEMIGKMATVKYFGMTNTDRPVPNLPVFKNLVLEKDR